MKEINVRIENAKDYKSNWFVARTQDDYDAFIAIVGDGWEDGKRGSLANAWNIMQKEGWIHDKSIGEMSMSSFYIVWVKPENDVEKLELTLRHHDWWYQMSDDYGVYSSGEKARKNIEAMMKKVEPSVAKELYEKYCPYKKVD
jgi:hypothetical protein